MWWIAGSVVGVFIIGLSIHYYNLKKKKGSESDIYPMW
jgi:hypothetical protein